jgi:hypothetical protein
MKGIFYIFDILEFDAAAGPSQIILRILESDSVLKQNITQQI